MTSENKGRTKESYYHKLFGKQHPVAPKVSVEAVVSRVSECIKDSLDDYLIMRDVQLIGSDGNVFESHPVIHVATDVVRDEDGNIEKATVYKAIGYLENKVEVPAGYISALPTMALNCAILIHAFKHGVEKQEDETYVTKDAEWQAVLDQFVDYGPGYGWQACATIIGAATNKIIDNPRDEDFPQSYRGGNVSRNIQQRTYMFDIDGLEHKAISKIDRSSNLYKFFQDLTGQQDLVVFDEIAKYINWKFDRNIEAKLWVPANNCYCSAWVGSSSNSLDVYANDNLINDNAFRGVLLEKDAGS